MSSTKPVRSRRVVSQAKMQRMRKAIEGCGLPFRGFRTLPDGSVEALVGEPAALTPTAEPALPSERLDDELAEWAEKNGYN